MKKTIHPCCLRPALLKAVLLAMLVVVGVRGGAQSWNWASAAGGYSPEYPCEVAVDLENNLYIGFTSLSNPCNFNSGSYALWGESDFFIVKYDSNGNEVWVKQCGGPYWPFMGNAGSDALTALRFDPVSNSLYAFGGFVNSCDFGEVTLSCYTFNNMDFFLAKFSLEGECIWAKRSGCTATNDNWDRAFSMAIDGNGNIFVSGYLPYSGTFGNITAQYGGNLAKFNSDGNCLWVKRLFYPSSSGLLPPVSFSSSIINNENLYLAGFNDASVFTIDTMSFSTDGYSGQILSSFSLEGNIQWLKCIGGPSPSGTINEIVTDIDGNIYFSSSFTGTYATFEEDSIFSTASKEMYVVKYNQNGEKIWIRQANASQSVQGYGVCRGNDNSLFLTGSFYGMINMETFSLIAETYKDIYILKMDVEGNFLGADNANKGVGYYIKESQNGSVNVLGVFVGTATFGKTILQEQGTSFGDIFIAQHAPISHVGVTEKQPTSHYDLLIYANPSTGICNISIPEELQHEENLTLLVFDNAGKLILQKDINMQEEKISLNLQAEAKGIYNAILTNGKQKFQGKVVVE